MILVTGVAGFIGSCLVKNLNESGIKEIVVSDKMNDGEKWKNVRQLAFKEWIERDKLIKWLKKNINKIEVIVHLGGCSSTMENDGNYLLQTNFNFTKELYTIANINCKKFIYASSASTYGNGEFSYDDTLDYDTQHLFVSQNKYALSKKMVDDYIFTATKFKKNNVIGLKFFNVYGPNEYHKLNMKSMVLQIFEQFMEKKKIQIFDTKTEEYQLGALRDFIYVKDVIEIIKFFIEKDCPSGLYNVGTGSPNSYENLAYYTIKSILPEINSLDNFLEYIKMPEKLKTNYQYYTCGNVDKLRKIGYDRPFYSLENGIYDYVNTYLLEKKYY